MNSNDFAVTIGAATANALLTDNNTKILQNPRIRAADQQKATMKIGSRIPIATGSYQTGAATALVSSLVNTQFQYQDVGVNIEMTPTVHFDRDVTLKIKIEVTAQSGSVTISGVTEPIISQRVAEQTIRLREGEANILGGIQEQQIQDNWSGIPGLSSIPILRYLFGSKDKILQDDEIVFLVVPHVVRSQELSPTNLRTIDTGAGSQTVELRHTSATAVPPPVTAPPANRPIQELCRGASAEAAAPAALAQMRAEAANGAAAEANRAATAASPPACLCCPVVRRKSQSDAEFTGNGDQRHHIPGSGGINGRNGCFICSLADAIRSVEAVAGQRGRRRLAESRRTDCGDGAS